MWFSAKCPGLSAFMLKYNKAESTSLNEDKYKAFNTMPGLTV
jgi:hypothetical protein